RLDALPKIDKVRFRHIDTEGADGGRGLRHTVVFRHGGPLSQPAVVGAGERVVQPIAVARAPPGNQRPPSSAPRPPTPARCPSANHRFLLMRGRAERAIPSRMLLFKGVGGSGRPDPARFRPALSSKQYSDAVPHRSTID